VCVPGHQRGSRARPFENVYSEFRILYKNSGAWNIPWHHSDFFQLLHLEALQQGAIRWQPVLVIGHKVRPEVRLAVKGDAISACKLVAGVALAAQVRRIGAAASVGGLLTLLVLLLASPVDELVVDL
jgi:hypothetical protein